MNKIFAIGDIHGCQKNLQRLIQVIAADPQNDRLVFLGDFIDRSPGGREVVDYVLTLTKDYGKVTCLCGNHESMFMRYIDGKDEDLYLANGGRMTLQAYGISPWDGPLMRRKKIPIKHLRFFEALLPYYETDQYIFVHAGLFPGIPLADQDIQDLQWIRETFIDSEYDFGKRVVFGHTHFTAPLVTANKIGIDTGAVYGGKLTCVELPTLKFYQV